MSDTAGSPSSLSPIEQVLVGVVVAAGALGMVVWGGAVVSSAVAGRGRLPVGLSDAVGAIGPLARSPGRPSFVWPAPVRDRIAEAPLYWTATACVLLAVAAAALMGVSCWQRLTPTRRRLGVDAQARFATAASCARCWSARRCRAGWCSARGVGGWWRRRPNAGHRRSDRVGGVWAWVTGRVDRADEGDVTSVAIGGPTRSGKTLECAIPAVLDWVGPAILLSVKRDLMDTTIARRRKLGEVRVFDPGGLSAAT